MREEHKILYPVQESSQISLFSMIFLQVFRSITSENDIVWESIKGEAPYGKINLLVTKKAISSVSSGCKSVNNIQLESFVLIRNLKIKFEYRELVSSLKRTYFFCLALIL